ncbi:YqaE/Pmp3 family membrane protein [Gemmata sp. JC717]|uniref:YqaE/Pmp3 family membrane protein n=1 Tax=Gemmata algarum TaxID=2975278 RepID=A0ABU5EVL8_9BACT|nr:YqaE/Pmp3 family membrane protein [Gemmata algarum]MDY3552907.1 YqaE/Pmp3 family membrane protein [Gemmata algarum]MDY3559240.1 YqaE/Pmp3 family membrane protein [Gemmata algarum]
MLALLVVLCPPFAVLLTDSPSQVFKNVGLTLLFYVPGVLHARSVVETYRTHRRYDSLMRVLESRAARSTSRQPVLTAR